MPFVTRGKEETLGMRWTMGEILYAKGAHRTLDVYSVALHHKRDKKR